MKSWLVAAWLALISQAQAETFSFALIGDVPYSDNERRELPRMLEAIADSQVDFVAHVGDFKHGSARCDDNVFIDRQQLFGSSRVPFVFIPGDNEWTDCERLSNGAYAQQERLDKLRSLFWHDNQSLGQKKLALTRQPGPYLEHSRFQLGPVLFVTLNLPGGNNNYGLADTPSADFQARNPAVLGWLKEGFALARQQKLKGIVLLFQADPSFKNFAQGFAHKGYRAFLETLRDETRQFSGQVVAVHGDTHISRIDQPLRDAMGRPLHNFIRVETFGYPLMGWTRAAIDTDSASLFRFETRPWPDK